jgi:hypothetical protein
MRRLAIVCCLSILFSIPAFGQKVAVDYDHGADFSKYKTYAWITTQNPAPSQLGEKRLIEAVNAELAAKGLREAPLEQADMAVRYGIGFKERVQVTGTDFGYGYSPYRWGGGTVTYDSTYYTDATLVLDLIDVKEKALLWRGTASDTVSDNPEKNEKKIKKSAEKMFKKFPPPQPK